MGQQPVSQSKSQAARLNGISGRQLEEIDRKLNRLMIDVAGLEQSRTPSEPTRSSLNSEQLLLIEKRLELLQTQLEQMATVQSPPAGSMPRRANEPFTDEQHTNTQDDHLGSSARRQLPHSARPEVRECGRDLGGFRW